MTLNKLEQLALPPTVRYDRAVKKCHKLPRIASRTRAFWSENSEREHRGGRPMEVADLVLPVFAVIVTGWLAGWLGYIPRSLADGLVHFA